MCHYAFFDGATLCCHVRLPNDCWRGNLEMRQCQWSFDCHKFTWSTLGINPGFRGKMPAGRAWLVMRWWSLIGQVVGKAYGMAEDSSYRIWCKLAAVIELMAVAQSHVKWQDLLRLLGIRRHWSSSEAWPIVVFGSNDVASRGCVTRRLFFALLLCESTKFWSCLCQHFPFSDSLSEFW